MAARQFVRVGHLVHHVPAAALCARQGALQPRAVGHHKCDLDHPGRSDRPLPGDPRHRRLLGRDPGKISLHPVRHLSVRRAMAAGAGDADLHRAVLFVEPPQHVGPEADIGVGRRTGADRRVDVGRPVRPVLCLAGSLGRPAGDADPRNLRARLRLPARDPRGARPPLKTARDPLALRALCRTDPRRSPDQPACSWRA